MNILNGIYLNTCTVFFNKKFFGARKGHFFQKNVGFQKEKICKFIGINWKKWKKWEKVKKDAKEAKHVYFFAFAQSFF